MDTNFHMQIENINSPDAGASAENLEGLPRFEHEIGNEASTEGLPIFTQRETEVFAPEMSEQTDQIAKVFSEIPELSYENWKELSLTDRVETLSRLETEVARIEMRYPAKVVSVHYPPGKIGNYNDGQMNLNVSVLADGSYEAYKQTMNVFFHEGRHAYQIFNLNVCRTEPIGTLVDAWQINMKELGYEEADAYKGDILERVGFLRYYNQPTEVDARMFAEMQMKKLGI